MRTWSTIVAMILATLCAGCLKFVADKPTFAKPNSTKADYDKDTYECERDTRQAQIVNIHESQNFFNRCMIARGWQIRRID